MGFPGQDCTPWSHGLRPAFLLEQDSKPFHFEPTPGASSGEKAGQAQARCPDSTPVGDRDYDSTPFYKGRSIFLYFGVFRTAIDAERRADRTEMEP